MYYANFCLKEKNSNKYSICRKIETQWGLDPHAVLHDHLYSPFGNKWLDD